MRTTMHNVEYKTRYVRARPTMAFLLSSASHFKPGTVTTRLCISAIGSEFEFMNMDAAIAKALIRVLSAKFGLKKGQRSIPLRLFQPHDYSEEVCDDHGHEGGDDEEYGYDP